MKIKDKKVWMAPPDHSGISRKSPGGALEFDGDRNDQTTVSRFLSGHLKCMTFESGRKVFQTCPKCHLLPPSPENILDCLGFALEDVLASPLLVLDFARDVLTSLCKSIKEDVDTGVNRILFLCKPLDNDETSTINMRNLNSTILNHLFTTVNDEANGEASLHVSCIEINNDGVVDLLNSDGISKDLKLFQIPNLNTEIRNLSEKSVTVENEIDDILETIFQKNKDINYTDCCHTVLSSMVIVKNKNSDGFECIKVSRLMMSMIATSYAVLFRLQKGCSSPGVKVLDHGRLVMSSTPVPLKTCREGQRCTLNLSRAEMSSLCSELHAFPFFLSATLRGFPAEGGLNLLCTFLEGNDHLSTQSSRIFLFKWGCCLDILKNSLSNSKISIILVLPSVLDDFKQSLYEIETVSEIQNITIKPEVNEKLILRETLKDYAEEIKSLEKDLSAIRNANGISINKQKYRSLKNKLALTEEQVKELSMKRKLLSDSVNNKKEILTRHQQEIKLIDSKIQEERQKLNLTKTAVEETKQRKIFLDKVSDRGMPCHEFEPSTTKDPPCRAAMHVKSVERCGVVVRRGGASSGVVHVT
ncbi:kinesin-like protein KIF11 [Trichonephila clavipes]|nr:kinesin-like protein KIF11 [Trichonephila clavipes]